MKEPFSPGWPESPEDYTLVRFLIPHLEAEKGDIGLVIDKIENPNQEIGYVVEVGPWNCDGTPKAIVHVGKSGLELAEGEIPGFR